MKPQQLRIGNWVYQKDHGKCLVLGVPKKGEKLELGYFEDSIGFERRIGTIYPIPLTEQWLENFGFFYHQGWWLDKYARHEHFRQFQLIGESLIKFMGGFYAYGQHVHSFQNLFYCLTGQELEKQ